MIDVNCIECGKSFQAQRKSAKFCSSNCRVKWNKKESDSLLKEVEMPTTPPELDEPDMRVESKGNLAFFPSNSKLDKLRKTIDGLNKKYGDGTAMILGDLPNKKFEVVSTGVKGIDDALGIGGFPKGRIIEIYGPESCLYENTFIQYEIRTKDGKRQNHKGGTIKRLFERFNKVEVLGQGFYTRPKSIDSEYFAPCLNEYNRVFQNKIEAVVYTGIKECFEIKTLKGFVIQATAEHKFFIGDKFLPLKDLSVGSIVMIHNNTPFKVKEAKPIPNRKYIFTKNHPVSGTKVIDSKYTYSRVLKSRMVFEAAMNNLSFSEFKNRLESNKLNGLLFLDRKDHIHHIDEDATNDELSNLVLISASEHGKLHSMERHNNLRFTAVPDEIISITPVGNRHTYDIRMQSPFNNYVANNFVVHNSGKTSIALSTIAQAQKAGLNCAFIDAEHSFDDGYARLLGVNTERLILIQPDFGEAALDAAENFVVNGDADVVVVDSVAALIPKAELEGEMGDSKIGLQARLMSQAMRKLVSPISKSNSVVIFINQLRDKIGVMFGSPETTTGGNALKYYASVRLDVRKIGQIKDGDEVKGNKVRVRVAKSKVSAPFKTTEFDFLYGIGIDTVGNVIDIALVRGILDKSGSWYSYKDIKVGQGREQTRQFLLSNPKIFEEINMLIK